MITAQMLTGIGKYKTLGKKCVRIEIILQWSAFKKEIQLPFRTGKMVKKNCATLIV